MWKNTKGGYSLKKFQASLEFGSIEKFSGFSVCVHLSFLNPVLLVQSKHRKQMPSDGVACLDNGMYKIWFARCYKVHCCSSSAFLFCQLLCSIALLSECTATFLHCLAQDRPLFVFVGVPHVFGGYFFPTW